MLNKKRILILGATSAIAEQTARLWATQGHMLYLMARDIVRLEIIASDLTLRGAEQVYLKCVDLSETRENMALLQEAVDALGGLDIVLLTYGVLGEQVICMQDVAASAQVLQTNFISPVAWLTVIANQLEQQGQGTIAVIASVAGLRGRASNYVYGASKGGLMVFLQGLRQRLARKDVHVLTVLPGFVDTPMTTHFSKNALWASPERVACDLVQAVEKRKDVLYTPWYWRFIMCIVLSIPENIFKKMRF